MLPAAHEDDWSLEFRHPHPNETFTFIRIVDDMILYGDHTKLNALFSH